MSSLIALNSADELATISSKARKAGQGLALLFTASWHAPCKQVVQVLEELATEFTGNVVLVTAEAEEENIAPLAERLAVDSVPTLFVFREANPDSVETVVKGVDVQKIVSEVTRIAKRAQVIGASAVLNEQKKAEDLNSRLEKLTHAAPVMLFMKGEPTGPKCKFSRAMVELLGSKGVKYGFFDILTDDSVREGLKTFSNWKTYPQLYIKGKLIGGLDIVKELDESGELMELINKANESNPEESLDARLEKLINAQPVMLFMKGEPDAPKCGFSRTIVQLLRHPKYSGLKFGHFDILSDNDVREGLKTYSNWKTYPQLYANGKLIGGLDIVRELDENDELAEVLPIN